MNDADISIGGISPIDVLLSLTKVGSLESRQLDELHELATQCPTSTSLDDMPIRTIHHLSCTGGTLFAKCVASMPNVVVLNEINPFSRMQIPKGKSAFTPTDIVALTRQGDSTLASDPIIKELFLDNLAVLRKQCWLTGRVLVLRDHSHSQFLHGPLDKDLPTLRDIVAERYPVRSVLTTRKPEDSFASMERQGWHRHMEHSTFLEYKRRNAVFLSKFPDTQVTAYEDLVREPASTMKSVCQALDLDFFDEFEELFSAFRFSGDSGRGGSVIRPLPTL